MQHSEAILGAPDERLTKDASAVFLEERQNIYIAASVLKQSVAAAFPHRFTSVTTAANAVPATEQSFVMSNPGDDVDTTSNFSYVPDPPKEAVIFDDEQQRQVNDARRRVVEAIEHVIDPSIVYDRSNSRDDVELAG